MKRTISSMLLALVLAVATQVVWAVVVLWLGAVPAMLRPPETKYVSLELQRDGTPVVVTNVSRGRRQISSTSQRLDHQPIADDGTGNWSSRSYGYYLAPEASGREHIRRLPWSERIRGYLAKGRGEARYTDNWYAVSEATGRTYFVAFDIETRRIVGYLGRDGFRESPPPPDDQFPLSIDYVSRSPAFAAQQPELEPFRVLPRGFAVYLPLPEEVVKVDLAARTVTSVWKGAGAIDAGILVEFDDVDERPRGAVIRTPTHLHVLDLDDRYKFGVELPAPLRDRLFYCSEFPTGGLMLMTVNRTGAEADNVGFVARLPIDGPAKVTEVPLDDSVDHGPYWPWPAIGLGLPQPVGLLAGWLLTKEMEDRANAASQRSQFWPTLSVVLVVSLVLAASAWRRQRRYGFGARVVWAGFVLLFGVPGWLAYRWHRAWPPLEACPACKAMAPRDREACCRCGAPFPPPRRESFEIRDGSL